MQTLAAKGSLGQIKARIRAEIFNALDQQVNKQTQKIYTNTIN
jgi:hypothetical protein